MMLMVFLWANLDLVVGGEKFWNARGVFSWLAVSELGYCEAEITRFLGVTTSYVTRAVSSGEVQKTKRNH